jgi:hypothetical protein
MGRDEMGVDGETKDPQAFVQVVLPNGGIPVGRAALEQFTVVISEPLSLRTAKADIMPLAVTDDTGVGTIVDNDLHPCVSIAPATQLEGNAGLSQMAFDVDLAAASGKTVKVRYKTVKGTATGAADYVYETGILTFAPGDTQETATIAIRGDLTVEANETFRVELFRPVATCLQRGASIATGTIQNDDGIRRR